MAVSLREFGALAVTFSYVDTATSFSQRPLATLGRWVFCRVLEEFCRDGFWTDHLFQSAVVQSWEVGRGASDATSSWARVQQMAQCAAVLQTLHHFDCFS
ncbi:hypothetical protein VTK73DRAFT_9288 [Phialemonium thermophilum]|uniref:Uncharacterized protein n=1 Tax=Phialemonium thermophilum TaxID=223376 RepID=A0ABR3XKB3_9PEZI